MDIKTNRKGAKSTVDIGRDFLAKIIPDDGVYIVFRVNRQTKKRRQTYHTDLDEMVDEIAWAASSGWDVYHACASFKTDQNRYAENARSLKALFVDLDCGEGKAAKGDGYATKEEAI